MKRNAGAGQIALEHDAVGAVHAIIVTVDCSGLNDSALKLEVKRPIEMNLRAQDAAHRLDDFKAPCLHLGDAVHAVLIGREERKACLRVDIHHRLMVAQGFPEHYTLCPSHPTYTAGGPMTPWKKRRIRREAARWLVELDTTEEIEALWPAFEAWLQPPEHRAAYLRLERAWRAMEALRPVFLRLCE